MRRAHHFETHRVEQQMENVEFLRSMGVSMSEVAERLGIREKSVERMFERAGRPIP